MESPLNPAIFRYLFNVAVGGLSVASFFSVYHQMYDMQSSMSTFFKRLDAEKNEEGKVAILHEILGRLQSDAIKKEFSSRLSTSKHGSSLVKLVKLAKDESNAESVSISLKVLVRVFSADAEGRQALYRLNAYKVLLSSLSEAHRQGNQNLMEEIADALKNLTRVDDEMVVLDTDVPKGSEGAYALAKMPATVKMLRIIDIESPILFLSALTGIFANICTLNIGAVNVGKGTDGYSGISFFFRLLEHNNHSIIENCVKAINYMTRAEVGLEEASTKENIERLADILRVNMESTIINHILTTILTMTGSRKYREPFLTHFISSVIPQRLFELWTRSPEKSIRNRAEMLCRLLSHIPLSASKISALLDRYRIEIADRRHKDEQEHQQKMQQMQQNQFMQRMMMEQMGIDPFSMG
ncbi:unnamed protein product [Phytomonas sp. EM1]|nr:unnamed protein product [Phytomonas sp. EM1]|eukprot:CCW62376.1 unnamed protein product [Phytomonas sp. isolate EM1]